MYSCAASLIVPSAFSVSITSNACRCPISQSFTSCAGVTFKAPVPNSRSTYSSKITGMLLSISGTSTRLPFKCA